MYQQEHELWSAMTPLFTKQWGDQKDISRGCAIFVMDTSDGGGTKFSCISGIIKEVQLKAAVVASFAGNMPYLGAFK